MRNVFVYQSQNRASFDPHVDFSGCDIYKISSLICSAIVLHCRTLTQFHVKPLKIEKAISFTMEWKGCSIPSKKKALLLLRSMEALFNTKHSFLTSYLGFNKKRNNISREGPREEVCMSVIGWKEKRYIFSPWGNNTDLLSCNSLVPHDNTNHYRGPW